MENGNREGGEPFSFFPRSQFPHIEVNYRVKPNDRTYVGHSLGGLFGAYVLLNKPEVFSGYVLSSPSVWFNDNYILSLKEKKSGSKTKVYLSVGNLEKPEFGEREDMLMGAKRLAEKLKK